MKRILLVLQLLSLANCKVFSPPNEGDANYWREYDVKFLEKVLKTQKPSKVAKNVILFVSDGMSLATITAGRILKGQMKGRSGEETELSFENFPHVGLAKTYLTNRQVPDSASTATAIFTGVKTSFFAVGLNNPKPNATESERLKSVIDWAQASGKRTGIVTNTRITHATPAAAYAYSYERFYECDARVPNTVSAEFKDIARQLVENEPGKRLNVIFGGGRDYLGAGDGLKSSCKRLDGENLVEKYLSSFEDHQRVKFVKNTGELRAVDVNDVDHILGLFANDHMDFESVRRKDLYGQPSLSEMTKKAIEILRNKNGFVLIVEGGMLDQAHHFNHARLALEELVEFDRAIETAREMTSVEDSLIIVTADHAQSMLFHGYPVRGSDILGFANENSKIPLFETLVYGNGPGYKYHFSEGSLLSFTQEQRKNPEYMHRSMIPLNDATHGGEDVGVFADGPGASLIQRVFEQCYIAYAISFASCIGPAAELNELCSQKPSPEA